MNFFKKKTKIIVDTNFLFIPGELGVDIFSEIHRIMLEPYEVCVHELSLEELEKLIVKLGSKKEAFNAKLGYIMAKQKGLKTIKGSSTHHVDDALIELVKKDPQHTIIATQDGLLKEKIKKLSGRVIELKQKKYLSLG